jgi:hypothetical protein
MRDFWMGLGYGTIFGFAVAMILVTAFGFGVK